MIVLLIDKNGSLYNNLNSPNIVLFDMNKKRIISGLLNVRR